MTNHVILTHLFGANLQLFQNIVKEGTKKENVRILSTNYKKINKTIVGKKKILE